MSKIVVPADQVPVFKSFAKRFSKKLADEDGLKLKGRGLLNLFAVGHKDYQDFLMFSKTCNGVKVEWESFPSLIGPVVASHFGKNDPSFISHIRYLMQDVMLEEPHIRSDIVKNISQAENPFAGLDSKVIAKTISQLMPSEQPMTLGEKYAANRRPIELTELHEEIFINARKAARNVEPVKRGSHSVTYNLRAYSNALYMLLPNTNGFSSLDLAGWILDHQRELYVSIQYDNGPSYFISFLDGLISESKLVPPSDIVELKFQPVDIVHELAFTRMTSKPSFGNTYDLMPFAEKLHPLLKDSGGYSPKALATWLVLNSRKMGIAFMHRGNPGYIPEYGPQDID